MIPSTATDEEIANLGEDVRLLDAIRTTRAIRRLRPDPVPPALIRKVCEAGTFAASGGNRQPWRFIAVTDPDRRTFVAERYRQAFGPYIQPALEAARSPDYPASQRKILQGAVYLAEHLHDVPVHLFVAGWKRRGREQTGSLFPCIQNILLACRAVGLGASLTTAHLSFGREIDQFLGLPEEIPSCALLPIGWPLTPYGRPVRKSVDECLFIDRFDPSSVQPR